MVNITFCGVRGSTPCPCDANQRYGGNTACVSIEAPGHDPIVLDLGTGPAVLRRARIAGDGAVPRALALVTHLHWDHVQGLPFFVPINRPGASLDVCGRRRRRARSARRSTSSCARRTSRSASATCVGDITFHDRRHRASSGVGRR